MKVDPQIPNTVKEKPYIMRVTFVSKALALGLFITLPIIALCIGYKHGVRYGTGLYKDNFAMEQFSNRMKEKASNNFTAEVEYDGYLFKYPASWTAEATDSDKGSSLQFRNNDYSDTEMLYVSVSSDTLNRSVENYLEFYEENAATFMLTRKTDVYLENFATTSRVYENANFVRNLKDRNPERTYIIPLVGGASLNVTMLNYNPLNETPNKVFTIDEAFIQEFLTSITRK